MTAEVLPMVSSEERSKLLREEFNIDPEKLEHYLDLFEQWISSQKHLPQSFNKTFLGKFLIWAKLDFEKAKERFVRYCYNPITHKEFITNRQVTPRHDLKCSEYIHILAMPKLTPDKHRIVIQQAFDPDQLDLLSMARYFVMSGEYIVHRDSFLIGNIILCDMRHWEARHYSKLFTVTLIKFLKLAFHNYPHSIKKILVFNLHPLLEKGVNLCLTILTEKIRERTLILNSHKDLREHIPEEFLPSDYGGSSESLEKLSKNWMQLLMENKAFLEELGEIKPTGPIPKEFILDEDDFGMEGSFRKLNID